MKVYQKQKSYYIITNIDPPSFFDPIIKKTLESIIRQTKHVEKNKGEENNEEKSENEMKTVFINYRGRVSENFEKALKKLDVPVKIIFTLRKLKTCLPSLKPKVDVSLRSKVVYKIECPCYQACYVGQTIRHFLCRFREHRRKSSPVGAHFAVCKVALSMNDVTILRSTFRSSDYLMTLEALLINDIKPSLNTKDEYRSCAFVIKL